MNSPPLSTISNIMIGNATSSALTKKDEIFLQCEGRDSKYLNDDVGKGVNVQITSPLDDQIQISNVPNNNDVSDPNEIIIKSSSPDFENIIRKPISPTKDTNEDNHAVSPEKKRKLDALGTSPFNEARTKQTKIVKSPQLPEEAIAPDVKMSEVKCSEQPLVKCSEQSLVKCSEQPLVKCSKQPLALEKCGNSSFESKEYYCSNDSSLKAPTDHGVEQIIEMDMDKGEIETVSYSDQSENHLFKEAPKISSTDLNESENDLSKAAPKTDETIDNDMAPFSPFSKISKVTTPENKNLFLHGELKQDISNDEAQNEGSKLKDEVGKSNDEITRPLSTPEILEPAEKENMLQSKNILSQDPDENSNDCKMDEKMIMLMEETAPVNQKATTHNDTSSIVASSNENVSTLKDDKVEAATDEQSEHSERTSSDLIDTPNGTSMNTISKISLVPNETDREKMSGYVYLLTQNIELFQSINDDGNGNGSYGDQDNGRVGLRCIHCADRKSHFSAACFFPSAVGSISSGLGTITTKHILGEKCPDIDVAIVEELRVAKQRHLQTKLPGKMGLAAYCEYFAKRNGMKDGEAGIEICKPVESIGATIAHENTATSHLNAAGYDNAKASNGNDRDLVAGRKKRQQKRTSKAVINNNANDSTTSSSTVSVFIPGAINLFWECKQCNNIPHPYRAAGSVVFSACVPPPSLTKKHLKACRGKSALPVPRGCNIRLRTARNNPLLVTIKWDGSALMRKKKNKLRSRKSIASSSSTTTGGRRQRSIYDGKKYDPEAPLPTLPLTIPSHKNLTTDFAYLTVLQLRTTRLTTSDSSRENVPLGYPGLACKHCYNQPNGRKFFFTSADHFRNSFSHISCHLMLCSSCPNDVKRMINDFKIIRPQQKCLLRAGSHKTFTDGVWDRMHGLVHRDDDTYDSDASDTDEDSFNDGNSETFGTFLDKPAAIDCGTLLSPQDKALTSDFVYFTLRQVAIYHLTSKDVTQGGPGRNTASSFDVGFPALICGFCRDQKFINRSVDHFRQSFENIPEHLMTFCPHCPREVKRQLTAYRDIQTFQEAKLKRGSKMEFMHRVFDRLITLDKSTKSVVSSSSTPPLPPSTLVFPEDYHLVTQFTYFTMQQMVPCSLTKEGNGSRGGFGVGFAGLACGHCHGQRQGRTFFYRTADILGGNYSHIPNHLMACKMCPLKIKKEIERKKSAHLEEKGKLGRGSQKVFFRRVWRRLHKDNAEVDVKQESAKGE